jgi:hypothetical protein
MKNTVKLVLEFRSLDSMREYVQAHFPVNIGVYKADSLGFIGTAGAYIVRSTSEYRNPIEKLYARGRR